VSLSEDQRALLRLLVAGDTYDQIGEVLGADPADVRARAHTALADLEQLGTETDLAVAVRERLAELDGPPEEPGEIGPGEAMRGSRRLPHPAWFAVAAVAVLAVIVFVVVLGDDGPGQPAEPPAADREDVFPVKLEPVGGSKAAGGARIIRVEDRPAIELEATGLEPSRPGETYVLWMLSADGRGLPIAFRDVGPGGRFSGTTPIPPAATGLLPSIETLDLSVVREGETSDALRAAAEGNVLPPHQGTTVLRGALR
jgi:hypothetical protein